MHNKWIIEARMSEERLKSQLAAAQTECDRIVGRFEHLDREPTLEERDARRTDFLASRKRLGELRSKLLVLKCAKTA